MWQMTCSGDGRDFAKTLTDIRARQFIILSEAKSTHFILIHRSVRCSRLTGVSASVKSV